MSLLTVQSRAGRTLAGQHQLPMERGHTEPATDRETLPSHQLLTLTSTDEQPGCVKSTLWLKTFGTWSSCASENPNRIDFHWSWWLGNKVLDSLDLESLARISKIKCQNILMWKHFYTSANTWETNLTIPPVCWGNLGKTTQAATVQSTRMSTWTFQELVPQAFHWSVCFQNINFPTLNCTKCYLVAN